MKIKPYSLLIICVLMIVVILNWSWTYFQPDPIRYTKPVDSPITMCSSWSFNWTDTTLMGTKILPGLGDLRYPVTTTSTKAQEFFEQGLRLVYAFNHWEAAQAFRKSAQLDPECAMAYWGMALAYG